MRVENENSFKVALNDSISLFLGAGFSLLAKSTVHRKTGIAHTSPLPLGTELGRELIEIFGLENLSKLPLPKLITVIKKTRRDELERFLKQRFTVTEYDPRYFRVFDYGVRSVFTTNIDDLIQKILSNHASRYLHDVTLKGPHLDDRAAINFFPLHGSITHQEPDYKFTTEELVTAFGQDRDRFHYLSKEIQQTPTIFWGYALEDAGVIEALSDDTTHGRSHASKWIVMHKEDTATEAYFNAQGFSIIIASSDQLLDYLTAVAPARKNSTTKAPTSVLFPDHYIPSNSEVKVRPITSFLSGDTPEWYDVYSNAIHHTSHYNKLLDNINSNFHTLFLGIPGSGKSTLLKQLAADLNSRGHKLFMQLITLEQVASIEKRLDGHPATIFVDDFADDIEACVTLMKCNNVQVVGCAREFFFDLISHRLDLSTTKVSNVSELTDIDVQAIFDRIPISIRANNFARPRQNNNQTISFFELIEANVKTPSLQKRMHDALIDLRQMDICLYESLIAIAYVSACGTPMTSDMIHAFLRPHATPITDIPKIFNKLGSLIKDYIGDGADTRQDNYKIRSKIISDALLGRTPQNDFRKIFEQFHEEVSPYRITRFDVFRRRAFDERFSTMAFSNWIDGLNFYENAYNRDGSPELLQQCALYLSHRDQPKLAFQWIDKAKLKAPKSFSVKNSHAIILFKANIGLIGSDLGVTPLLIQSMDILAECYKSDRRKTYHAKIFADQALKLYNALKRTDATEKYLLDARSWISNELRDQPWDRRLSYLKQRLDHII